MTEDEFWGFIDLLDWDKTGDDDAVIEPLVDALSKKEVDNIYAFENTLAEKLFLLDGRKYAEKRNFLGLKKKAEYLSPDDFLYSRCTVVANGPEFFDEVITNPNRFPHELEFEILLVISLLAYIRKTGEEWDFVPKTNYETYSNREGWK